MKLTRRTERDELVILSELLPLTTQDIDVPVHCRDFADFERCMLDVSYTERRFDSALRERVLVDFAPHMGPGGAHCTQPMHVRLLRKLHAGAAPSF